MECEAKESDMLLLSLGCMNWGWDWNLYCYGCWIESCWNHVVFICSHLMAQFLSMWIDVSMSNIENKLLDYWPLMNAINQHKTTHHWCQWESRCLSTSYQVRIDVSKASHLENPTNMGHWCIPNAYWWGIFPLRHASLKVLERSLVLILDDVSESMGQNLLEGRP